MTKVTKVMTRTRLGLDLHDFQMAVLEKVGDAIRDKLPSTSELFEGENNDRHIRMVCTSWQGTQKGPEPGQFDPLLLVQICEGFNGPGMVVIGWFFLSTRGVMADAVDDALFDIITGAVAEVGEESDEVTIVGAQLADGTRVDGQTFMDATRPVKSNDLFQSLLNMMGQPPKEEDES